MTQEAVRLAATMIAADVTKKYKVPDTYGDEVLISEIETYIKNATPPVTPSEKLGRVWDAYLAHVPVAHPDWVLPKPKNKKTA